MKKEVVIWYDIIDGNLFLKVPIGFFGRIPKDLKKELSKLGEFEGVGNVLQLKKSDYAPEEIVEKPLEGKEIKYVFLPRSKNLMKEKDYQDFNDKILFLLISEEY